MVKQSLTEYLNARKIAQNFGNIVDINKINERIRDMKLRMPSKDFEDLEKRYG